MDLTLIHPVRTLKVDGLELEVREMAWPKALELFKRLGARLAVLVAAQRLAGEESEAYLQRIAASFGELIAGAEDLSTLLLQSSVSCPARPGDTAWLADISVGGFIDLLDAAIEMNLRPEVLARGKKLAGRLQGVLAPAMTTPTPAASPVP